MREVDTAGSASWTQLGTGGAFGSVFDVPVSADSILVVWDGERYCGTCEAV